MSENKLNIKILLHMKGFKYLFYISFVVTTLRVFVNFITPQVIRFTVDSIISEEVVKSTIVINFINFFGGRNYIRENIWICALAIIILAIITCICDYLGRTSNAKASEKLMKNIRNSLYEHIQKLPYSWHIKNQTGDTIQRSTSDVEMVRNFISSQLMELFRTIMLIVISLILMFSMNYLLSLIVLIFVPIIIIYSSIFYGILSKQFLIADEAEGQLFNAAQENLTGVRVVRAFGREKYEIEKFSKRNREFSDLWVKLGYKLGIYWGVGDLVTGLQIMVVIYVGVIQASKGTITLGEFLAFISYNAMLTWPVRSFGRILGELSKTKVSLNRICEILKEPEEKDEINNDTPNLSQDIEFKNVNFKYDNNRPVLKDISFKIKSKTTFAILGGTGSGKTTLMHLLNRLYDLSEDEGAITIGNVNIKNIKRDYLRKNIGMVLQEPFLFSKTIKDNIKIAKPDASIEEIKSVADVAQVAKSIENFEKGYDTIVGERGVTLSGGQKQRVAIARMILQNTPIMVFDDSLSAVDSETDSKIRNELKKRKNKATTILISHRITTLMESDMILVLDKGEIADIGTHEELIKRDGIYKNIYDVQMNLSI